MFSKIKESTEIFFFVCLLVVNVKASSAHVSDYIHIFACLQIHIQKLLVEHPTVCTIPEY